MRTATINIVHILQADTINFSGDISNFSPVTRNEQEMC